MAESNKDKIQNVLSEQFEKYRYIFWYDAEGTMEEFAMSMDIEGVITIQLQDNPFSVKHQILMGEQPERGFLIYSKSVEPSVDDNWLLDLQEEGIKFSADMASLYATECNIPLELKSRIVDEHINFFSLAKNRTKLAALVTSGMSGKEILNLMLAVTANIPIASYDQLTYILADQCINNKTDLVDKLNRYNIFDIYWNMVKSAFGFNASHNIRDLIIVLFKDELASILVASELTNEAHIFMRDWRDSRQYGEMYQKWAEQLEQELGVMNQIKELPIDKLIQIETFPCVDKVIAQYLRKEVLNGTITADKAEAIVDERRNKIFFGVAQHTIMALLEARRLFEAIEKKMAGLNLVSAEEGFKLYVNELFVIDQHYRHFFREANQAESHNLMADITTKVEQVYTNSYLTELAKKWQPLTDTLDKWQLSGIPSQQYFYQSNVEPFMIKGRRLFVIISDALRYETMKELEQRIAQENRMETTMKNAMLSVLPSYTQLGMAALLPHKELSYEKETDEVFADGKSTKGTENRTKVLQATIKRSVAIKAEEFLVIPNGREWVKDYDLVYIYSNTIDKVGDTLATETNVFKATEDEMEKLVRIVKFISFCNGANMIITADHGYIYQNETLDETDFTDFKTDAGTCFIEKRRFVIGKDLWEGKGVRTWKSEQLGIKEGVDVQICKSINRIRKQGSGNRFVHGGCMPQEVIVPVLHVNVKKTTDVKQVDVDILGKQARITTANQSVKFYQTEPASEKVKGMTLRMGFYTTDGEVISDTITMTFDTNSSDSKQREQKHTFRFKNVISKLNGQEVILRMERQLENSNQFAPYKEEIYKVSVMFELEW